MFGKLKGVLMISLARPRQKEVINREIDQMLRRLGEGGAGESWTWAEIKGRLRGWSKGLKRLEKEVIGYMPDAWCRRAREVGEYELRKNGPAVMELRVRFNKIRQVVSGAGEGIRQGREDDAFRATRLCL